MSPADWEFFDLFAALGLPERRAEAARALAARVGAEELLLFVRDAELGVLVPAPGFDQTLPGGPSWREWLRTCGLGGRQEGRVEFPPGSYRNALCLGADQVAAVFLGGVFAPAPLAMFERVMPLVARGLVAEQRARLAEAEAAVARGAADRARMLAQALEAARAEHAHLNARLHSEHRRKDDFLAMLAHELRNPLTPLVTSIELIRHAQGVATERQLEIMARQVRHLSRLVEDLLDVSRVSRGRIDLRRQGLRLGDVVADALEATRPFLEGRRHRVELDLSAADARVFGDSTRLTQVFVNLLHNAGKYTDPNGLICIRARREDGEAVVSVTDNGMGIEPGLTDQIFDLFAQVSTSLARSQGGLGIGLTLVRALVELHGGEVTASSQGLGCGSTFAVRLPVMLEEPAAPPPGTCAGEPARLLDRALRVLIVDDNKDAADSMAQMLRLLGHQTEVAYSGLKAMVVAEAIEPDLVLLDIGLPELDGYEIARRLRRGTRRDLRLVAVTGYGAERDKRRAQAAGFDEHVTKPVMPETLHAIVARVRGPAGAHADAREG